MQGQFYFIKMGLSVRMADVDSNAIFWKICETSECVPYTLFLQHSAKIPQQDSKQDSRNLFTLIKHLMGILGKNRQNCIIVYCELKIYLV